MPDNVLNLSAFGEVIEPPGKRQYSQPEMEPEIPTRIPLEPISTPKGGEKNGSKASSSKTNQISKMVLQNMIQAKLLHWQTQSYSEHKALDGFFESFIGLSDNLVESIMGKYGRPNYSEGESSFTLTNYRNPESPDGLPDFMSELDQCYRKECSSVFSPEEDPEILNLIQEIMSLIDKTKYLLTLKK
jgi:hypothetical protein